MMKDPRSVAPEPIPPGKMLRELHGDKAQGNPTLSLRTRIAQQAVALINDPGFQIDRFDIQLILAIRAIEYGSLTVVVNQGKPVKIETTEAVDFGKEGI